MAESLPIDPNQQPDTPAPTDPAAVTQQLTAEAEAHAGAPLSDDQKQSIQAAVQQAGGDPDKARAVLQLPQPDTIGDAGPNPPSAEHQWGGSLSPHDRDALKDWRSIGSSVAGAAKTLADPLTESRSPAGLSSKLADEGDRGPPRSAYNPAQKDVDDWRPVVEGTGAHGALSSKLDDKQSSETATQTKSISDRMKEDVGVSTPSLEFQTIDLASIHRAQAEHVDVPKALEQNVQDLEKEKQQFGDNFRGDMSKQEQKVFDEWEAKKQQLLSVYNEAKERVGVGQAISIIGEGMAKLAAGLYGMKTGVDTSGIQFSAVDWSHDFQRTLDEYKMGVDQLHGQMEPRLQAIQNKRKDFENWQMRMAQAQSNLGQAQLSAGEANARSDNEADREYQNKLFEANKFNMTEKNAALRWQKQFDVDYARIGKQLPESQLNVARTVYTKDAEDWMQARKGYAEGIAELQEASNEPQGKMRDQKVQQALKKIGGYTQNPDGTAQAVKEAGTTGGFLGLNQHTDFAGVVEKLEKMPKREPPRFGDYMPGGRQWGGIQKMSEISDSVTSPSASAPTAPQTNSPPPGARPILNGPNKGKWASQGADGQWHVISQ